MIAGIAAIYIVFYDGCARGLEITFVKDEIDLSALVFFGVVLTLEFVNGETGFSVAMNVSVSIFPSSLFHHFVNLVGSAGIKISCQYLPQLGLILGSIIQHNFDLLFPCGLAHMIE